MDRLCERALERMAALRETARVCPRSRLAAELDATIALLQDCVRAIETGQHPAIQSAGPSTPASASDRPR